MPRRATATSYGNKSGNARGRGPAKGDGGAATKPLRLFLADLRNSAKAQLALRAAAEDADSRSFGAAWKLLSDYDDEKPAQRIVVDIDRIKSMTDAELRAVVAGKKL